MAVIFKKILVANRGEIATRIFQAATELNVQTVAIYSHEDRFSIHRYKADEAYKLGEAGKPLEAYLNIDAIVDIARRVGAEAIHPGYGFLSENPQFAAACEKAGIVFIGPSVKHLEMFGDKLAAKAQARECGIPVIEGSTEPLRDVKEALQFASKLGFPITLKAQSGGGGKGIRVVHSETDWKEAFERAAPEARASFGRSDIYIEKAILNPKHIEVQIMGDHFGNLVHVYERDCSIQRRHQKLVEIAPAVALPEHVRTKLCQSALQLARGVEYYGLGTVEFLVDEKGEIYFLEVNPRLQVEHTVTEMVSGIDLVQASILIACGKTLDHPAIRISSQDDVKVRGAAIQCRITTEDPKRNFAPDTGTLVAYRPALGFGVRLDSGSATTGAVITPHYDSLLVKVTAHARDFYGAVRKMDRALREFRIRGVKSNIPLLVNIMNDAVFRAGTYDTGYLERNPALFEFPIPRDRATKILYYLADVTINNPHELPRKAFADVVHESKDLEYFNSYVSEKVPPQLTAKEVFEKSGADGLVKWIRNQKQVLLTDTTMRDAHQSLFATRLRTRDILRILPFYKKNAAGFFSLEVWGGATFDVAYRFLKENPWKRLEDIREQMPNALLQMLLRGDNAVGYTNYPEWVVRDFIRLTVEAGLDVFRIFDCLNNPEQMEVAIDEVKKRGAIAEACICYTGNVSSPKESKYTLEYYVNLAKRLQSLGSDILCIKDMAGLLRPHAARQLISTLKEELKMPIHLHTHATSGNAEATLLAAIDAGCEIVDGAVSSMSGLTSQPSLNAVVAALEESDKAAAISVKTLDMLAVYWEEVRAMYEVFDPGVKATSTRVYEHEIPGGQFSNLYEQARQVGVSAEEFFELTERYREVNHLFGNIVKVTPSSKVVGDMALLLQKHGLTGPEWIKAKPKLDYPDSVLSFFRGHMGIPYGGFPDDVRALVLGPEAPPPEKIVVKDDDSLTDVMTDLQKKLDREVTEQEAISYRLYPKVFLDYIKHQRLFGRVSKLPTPYFFFGLKQDEEIEIDLEPGKTIIVSLRGISEPDGQGYRTVFFDLNGYSRKIRIQDHALAKATGLRPKADLMTPKHIGAAMPGKIIELRAQVGDVVKTGQVVVVTEAMKMEYAITVKADGKIAKIHVKAGDMIEDGDLLIELS